MMSKTDPLIGEEVAMQMIRAEPDRARRRLMTLVVAATGRLYADRGILPSEPLDLVYLVKVLQHAFADKDVLIAILEDRYAGEWFPEDE
jgi:hypothetical protein